MQVNMHEAKSQLSKLSELAHKGERVVIAKAGKPYVDLVPHRPEPITRAPGRFTGLIAMAEDFDESSAEIVSDFEGDA
jgi:antitoxin (DNA-binding transcriptional repressor) of toxin-antitoxin stability system